MRLDRSGKALETEVDELDVFLGKNFIVTHQDTYLSAVNNRMNEIMKTLTSITVLFMPLTFLSGYFGMNFFEPSGDLKEWTTSPVFSLTLAVIVILPFLMYLWTRRRTWV